MYRYAYFFFFKQKTAYEVRISDWSSDVCSSDLLHTFKDGRKNGAWRGKIIAALRYDTTGRGREHGRGFGIETAPRFRKRNAFLIPRFHRIRTGREPRLDRMNVESGKRGSVR